MESDPKGGWLAVFSHPKTRHLRIDDPRMTELRRDVIQENSFLKCIYDEWYSLLVSRIPQGSGRVLELGSGAGFLADYVPDVITSEIFVCQGVQAALDGRQLPFPTASLKAIVMVDVLHHIAETRPFLAEAKRCLRSEGALLMIEPWNSTWSRFIYTYLHHEPFDPMAEHWSFPSTGPLSGANGALPWIIFKRDQAIFEREFPSLEIREVQPIMPFRYLVSGGVSRRQLMPRAFFGLWRKLDNWLSAWPLHWPMFAVIEIRRL
jgi:SAM-dependent methyltransferase